jgi:hypothetical protein
MLELFHTSNIKLAATLDALGFDFHSPPVTRFTRDDKSETVTFWFQAGRQDGLHCGTVFNAFIRGQETPNEISAVDPIQFAQTLLESRNKCVEMIHDTPRYKHVTAGGKTMAIREDADEETRKKFAKIL